MSLLFKNPVCWNFFNLLFPLFPPLEVLHSVNICCLLPSLFLPSGRYWCSYPVLKKWHSKGMGRKEPQTTICCPFTPSFGDCSFSAAECEKVHHCTPSYWVASRKEKGLWPCDSVLHFGCILEKKPIFLLVDQQPSCMQWGPKPWI